jgi:hypothetical protein
MSSRRRSPGRDRVRDQLSFQRRTLASEGRLDLSRPHQFAPGDAAALRITDLSELGVQPRLRKLTLTRLPLESLRTLPAQPMLAAIVADETRINSFAGLGRHPRLRAVSFVGAPLAARPNFRISLAIVIGQHLTAVNGAPVTADERALANRYPLIARALVERGWDAEPEVPPIERLKALALEYRVRLRGIDAEFTTQAAQAYLRPPPTLPLRRPDSPPPEADAGADAGAGARAGAGGVLAAVRARLAEIGIHVASDEEEVLAAVERLAGIARRLHALADADDDADDAANETEAAAEADGAALESDGA